VNEIIEFIKKTPKAELHLHIEGTLEPNLLIKLAKRNNIKIPFANVDEVKFAYNFSNLESFLNIFYQGSKVLIKEQDFFDLTWAYILKCKEENIVHTEVFFDPQTHVNRGVNFDLVINGIHKALLKANKEFGLTSKIIMCFLRHLDEISAFKILDQALVHKDKIFGIGLDSSEKDHPPRKFERVFKKAIEKDFLTVAHAGEEGPSEYIWEALNLLKVKRIDHGVQCFQDEKLVQKLKIDQIPLTVCPLSNIKLRVFNTLQEHNLKKMLNAGLMVMINSDDPAYFDGYINKNYIETQKELNLSLREVKTLIINSFKSSFLDKEKKEYWIRQV
jgi:adenosine deaminase|tara:strand:+ start:1677 stop:2669 length:993 start_codon:yes stop_codon:yes gene_type:complete